MILNSKMGDSNLKDVFVGVLNEVQLSAVGNLNSDDISNKFKQWLQSEGFLQTGKVVFRVLLMKMNENSFGQNILFPFVCSIADDNPYDADVRRKIARLRKSGKSVTHIQHHVLVRQGIGHN